MTAQEVRRARAELRRYIEHVGGVQSAAKRLGRSASLLYKVLDGRRRMTVELAMLIERDAKAARIAPSLSPIVMVFGRRSSTD